MAVSSPLRISAPLWRCFPGKDGLVHISELADFRVNRTEDVAKMGDMIWVKCIGIDDKGRVKLSGKRRLRNAAKSKLVHQ